MPKSKESLALFELVHQAQQGSIESGIQEPASSVPPAELRPPSGSREASDDLECEPLVRKDGNRLRFSLSTAAMAVAIASLGMVAMGSFFVGRQVGAGHARRAMPADGIGDQISAVRNEPPQPGVWQDLELAGREARGQPVLDLPAASARGDGWIRGLNYVWVDTFDDLDDAERARAYLGEAGIGCTAVPIAESSRFRLITNQGFDLGVPGEKAACGRQEARIRELGQAYLKEKGGRYLFDCQVTKLKGDHW